MECYLRMDGALLPKTELIGVQVLFLNKVYTPGGGGAIRGDMHFAFFVHIPIFLQVLLAFFGQFLQVFCDFWGVFCCCCCCLFSFAF